MLTLDSLRLREQRVMALETRRQLASTGRLRHFDGFSISVSPAPQVPPVAVKPHVVEVPSLPLVRPSTAAATPLLSPAAPVVLPVPSKPPPLELQVRIWGC